MALPRDLAATRGLRDDASIVPYIGLWYRRVCCFPVGRSILPLAVGADSISARGGFRHRKVCGTMQASSPTLVCGIVGFVVSRLAAAFCLPCQREVARPQAVTEGLFYGQMPFQRGGVTEKFFCLELRLPGTAASFYAIPRSPLSPPLTRGPNQPANVPSAAGSGGMRASRPTVARVVAAAPVGRSVLPPLPKGGGTAAGRDGGIVLRPDAVSKKRRDGEILLF